MGQYFRPDDLQEQFAQPLAELASDFSKLSARWSNAFRTGGLARDDLLLNHGAARLGLRAIRKLLNEATEKLDDAIEGVYRYRNVERELAAAKRRGGAKRKRTKRSGKLDSSG